MGDGGFMKELACRSNEKLETLMRLPLAFENSHAEKRHCLACWNERQVKGSQSS